MREKINNMLAKHNLKNLQNLKEIPFRKMLPNMVTTMALCSGITSIRYAIMGEWTKAVICIFLSALFDGLDGRVARMLKASSKFGAELDSLSDFVSFGVAPALLIYLWQLKDFPRFGWIFCLLFAVCMAMRLARFNTMLEDEKHPAYWDNWFVGVPAPADAAIALMPLLISFDFPEFESFLRTNLFCSLLMIVVGTLMVSRIPTISTKKMKIHTSMMIPMLLLVAIIAHFLMTQPWITLGIMIILYIITIPVGVIIFLKQKHQYSKK